MKCIFCDKKADSDEHIWGRWLQKIYPTDNIVPKLPHFENRNDESGKSVVARGYRHGGEHPLYKTSKVVCVDCNNIWMSRIEEKTKRTFGRVFINGEKKISAEDATTLRRWVSLKFCVQERAEEFLVPEEISNSILQSQFLDLCEEQRIQRNHGFFEHRKLGSDFVIFIGRSIGRQQIGGSNHVPISESRISNGTIERLSYFSTCLLFVGPMHCLLSNDERVVSDVRRWILTAGIGLASLKELRASEKCHLQKIGVGSDVLEEFVLGLIESFDPGRKRRNFKVESEELKVIRSRKFRKI